MLTMKLHNTFNVFRLLLVTNNNLLLWSQVPQRAAFTMALFIAAGITMAVNGFKSRINRQLLTVVSF